jgi:hypothetical protein
MRRERREVFISYSTKDRQTAEQVCASLEALGIPCWMAPRDILPGKIWTEAIVEALDECRVMVIILSTNANKSKQVWREAQLADDVDITIVPFRIEAVIPAKTLKYYLALNHWLDALTPPLEYHVQLLASTVRTIIPPAPTEQSSKSSSAAPAPTSGVFSADGKLNAHLFAFHIGDVLLRAAFRRNRQHRARVSLTDFLLGLLKKGDLTRFLLRQRKIDPDALADELLRLIETEGGAGSNGYGATVEDEASWMANFDPETADDEQWRAFIARLVVRDREEFTDQLAARIEAAWQRACARTERPGEQRISEQDVLEAMIADPAWLQQTTLGLPNAVEMRHLLRERERAREVDENGVIVFPAFDDAAQNIIATAHMLAQQHGLFPIPHRMMFAAFLKSESGYAADIFRRRGNEPEELLRVMLGTADDEDTTSFALSVEACGRVVLAVVEEAKKIAAPGSAVTEQDLFQAFCRKAAADFKAWLRESPERIDLDNLEARGGDEEIVQQQLQEYVQRAAAPTGATVEIAPEVAPWLLKKAKSEGCDVSQIRIIIEQHVQTALMIALANLKGEQRARLLLAVRPDKLRVECRRREGPRHGHGY